MLQSSPPNFFIIGAPKCGTSSMFSWLADHPQVCRSNPKETWFFAGDELDHLDIKPNHRANRLSDYLNQFENVDQHTRIKMEGSTHYLYSEPARSAFSSFATRPQVLILLRNPATRIWSHFKYIKRKAKSPIEITFAEYVGDTIRAASTAKRKFTDDPWSQYLLDNLFRYSDYYQHVVAWQRSLSTSQVKVLVLENLTGNQRNTVREIADWLNVDHNFYDQYAFETVNVARSRGAAKLRAIARRCAKYLPTSVSEASRRIVDGALEDFNLKMTPAEHAATAAIEDYFQRKNLLLQHELGIDVTKWRGSSLEK